MPGVPSPSVGSPKNVSPAWRLTETRGMTENLRLNYHKGHHRSLSEGSNNFSIN